VDLFRTTHNAGAGAGGTTMLAHVKRIGKRQLTVAPYFLDLHYMPINRVKCLTKDIVWLPLMFV
jgi:hypothetical protein